MSSIPRKISVQVVSDVVCPWCYVGRKRLEAAMKQTTGYEFQIKWLPFFLNPTLEEDGVDKIQYYQKKFGQRAQSLMANMKQVGEKEGIKFSYGGKIANTLNSHRLLHYAEKFGKQDNVSNILFKNYFEEEKNLGSLDVLVTAGVEAGLEKEQLVSYLKSDDEKDLVINQAERIRQEFGVDGVPFFIFNDKFTLSGAQEPSTIVSLITKQLK